MNIVHDRRIELRKNNKYSPYYQYGSFNQLRSSWLSLNRLPLATPLFCYACLIMHNTRFFIHQCVRDPFDKVIFSIPTVRNAATPIISYLNSPVKMRTNPGLFISGISLNVLLIQLRWYLFQNS